MFLVTYIYRSASSGSESRTSKLFDTLEKAVEYICTDWYDSFCEINEYPSDWDEESLGRSMPTRDEFNIESLSKINLTRPTVIFGPYDQNCALVQNELHLEEVKHH